MKQINWKALLISLLISLGTGVIGGIFTSDSMQQYEQLYQPPLAPPGWVFPIVWTILFLLMGVASYLVFVSDADNKKQALTTYGIQLILNVGWSVIFFGFQAYFLAFVWLLILWYFIYRTIREFYAANPAAGMLLLPYIVWVTFAGYLNAAIAFNYMF